MHTRIRSLTFLAALAAVLRHAQARADIPPPDICDTEGAACDNAGPDADQSGTCESAQCSRPEPKPDGGVIVYDCLRCVPPGGGGGGDAGMSGCGGTGTSAGSDDGGCSCRFSGVSTERAAAAGMLLLGLGALRISQRRC